MRRQSLQHFKAPPHEISADHETERHFDKLDDQLGSAHLVAGVVAHVSLQSAAGRCPRMLQEALADRLELAPSRQHEHGRVRFCKDTRQETPTVRQLRILNEFAPFASMAPVPSWSGRFAVTPSKWARGVRARRMKDACDERTTADTGYGSGGGGIGGAVVRILLERQIPVRAFVRRDDE